jgi:FAD/FMN-containing dehydrogenase
MAALRAVVGPEHVLTDPDLVRTYTVDWTGRFRGHTDAVVRPVDTAQVAAVLSICNEAGLAVVPQGGNTGLVGGSVPLAGEIVLSLRRLAAVEPVDDLAGQVTACAGATLEAVQAQVRGTGLEVGVDLAARGSATIGGMVATNAGGLRVLRHGDMRAQVVGIEAALASGAVVRRMHGLVKDNTGFHLPSLMCGSEGTLAVVTAVRLRLVPALTERVTALLCFPNLDAAVAATAALRAGLPSLDAVEAFFADGLAIVCDHLGISPPVPRDAGAYLLVEAADTVDPTDAFASAVGGLDPAPTAAVVAADQRQRAELWRLREGHTEAINALGVPHKLDITLPASALAQFASDVRARVAAVAPDARTVLFGHLADGNLHVNVVGAGEGDEVDDAVLSLVVQHGGSISAEHGIGTAKKRWLPLDRSAAELDAFRAIKRALDPNGILNPNVLLP